MEAELRVTLTRGPSTSHGTFGVLQFGSDSVKTLELPWRDNRPQRSCIPAGTYRVSIVNSPKFGRVYGVQGVKGRSSILIHPANFAGDVDLGYTSQLHGCVSLHTRSGLMRNKAGNMQLAGLVSVPAVRKFMEWANGRPFTLEIK